MGTAVKDANCVRYLTDSFVPAVEDHVSEPTLIVAAHPDDGTISAAWALSNANRRGYVRLTDASAAKHSFQAVP